ncbi:uncharacterized protein [Rutidosis leptorrhynchoides]|uniref:uncharacterized protein n=1 Tax=Rutidosis leptorrhynchoides TaxID=125765 RepID=UPI003A99D11D
MVAAVSSNTKVLSRSPAKSKRAPLLPSENDNTSPPLPRQQKPKDVKSRNLSSTPSTNHKTYTTSSSSCSSSTTTTSSSNSVCTPKKQSKTKTFSRSLSVSFQGESFAIPVSKITKTENDGLRNGNGATERKKKAHGMQDKNFMTMSVDYASEKMKLNKSVSANAIKALRKSITSDTKSKYNNFEDLDHDVSDNVKGGGRRAIVVPARFWQETINLLKRPPLLKKNKVLDDGLKHSPIRNGVGSNNNMCNTPSILSFSADARRGKLGEKKIVDAHLLRMLHNKHLQWRFANAKVDAAMAVQRATALKSLYNAWVTVSKLWHSIIAKRVEMQQLKQNLKLYSVLKKQMSYLDNWDLNETDHSLSLAGAILALESSALCIPVISGAKANVRDLEDSFCSAVDVMQAMTVSVSICSLVTKVEYVNSLVSELANAMKSECSFLDQFKDLLSTLTLLEMQDCSIRVQNLQLTHNDAQRLNNERR